MFASGLNTLAGLILPMGMAERIKEAMGDMSRAELARATGVSPASVTFWLDGTTKSLNAEKAAQLEKATGYRATWIVTGTGPKRSGDKASQDATAAWPFSAELRERVAKMEPKEVSELEFAMWVYLHEDAPRSVAETRKRFRQRGAGMPQPGQSFQKTKRSG